MRRTAYLQCIDDNVDRGVCDDQKIAEEGQDLHVEENYVSKC